MNLDDLSTNDVWTEYDWAQVFPADSRDHGGGDYSGTFEAVAGGHGQRVADVTPNRIAEVVALSATSPEGYGSVNACALVRLTDGSWAALTAWADTTGWGCRADAQWRWSTSRADVVRYGMDDEGRRALGQVIDA